MTGFALYHSNFYSFRFSYENDKITELKIFEKDTDGAKNKKIQIDNDSAACQIKSYIFSPADSGIKTPLTDRAFAELCEYFKGSRKTFDIPYKLHGTLFQKKVWAELSKIPYGATRSYKDIAVAIGNKKACRAVGMANNKNPLPIIVPCHRVIGSSGKLTGYAYGLSMKEMLLAMEKRNTTF